MTARKLWCMSRQVALETEIPDGATLISITDPGSDQPFLDWPRALSLQFADVGSEDEPGAITDSQAGQILGAIKEAVESGRDIYVHCEAGRSRSQAVVRFVKSEYPGPWECNPGNPDDTPNYFVLGKLRENDRKEQDLHPSR